MPRFEVVMSDILGGVLTTIFTAEVLAEVLVVVVDVLVKFSDFFALPSNVARPESVVPRSSGQNAPADKEVVSTCLHSHSHSQS